jgi:YidC/Oxa1 family membrane protein insertase
MKDLGVDFGWGTTSLIKTAIEFIHVSFGGPPWWLTLGASVLLTRVVIFPLFLRASSQSQKMVIFGQKAKELQQKSTEAEQKGDQVEQFRLRKEQQAMAREMGLSFPKLFAPALIQAVLGFGVWRIGWKLSEIPQLGLSNGGFLWMHNLAIADPFYILPAVAGLLAHASSRLTMTPTMTPTMRGFMLYGLPLLLGGALIYQPGIVQFIILINIAFSSAQSMVFRNAAFRERMNMAPIVKSEAPIGPQKGFWDSVKDVQEQQKKAVEQRKAKASQIKSHSETAVPTKVALAKEYERKLEQARKQRAKR